jgi:hypothetical protein
MSNNLEFHYVVSYREGYGWTVAADVEQAVLPDGTIYDHDKQEWVISATGSEDRLESMLDTIDIEHYGMLNSALRLLNEGEINA